LSYDEERAETNTVYRDKARAYQSALRELGYKVIEKRVKWFQDEAGNRFGKANADLDMAVDVLLQSENLDRVLLVTGDGDFVQVVRALQNKGCRVETLAFDNVSEELRRESDMFISGYLVVHIRLSGARLTADPGRRLFRAGVGCHGLAGARVLLSSR